jgi:hypothetical protein
MESKKHLTLKFNLYVTDTSPCRPNVLPMWPARQKELRTPAIECIVNAEVKISQHVFWITVSSYVRSYQKINLICYSYFNQS